MKMKKRKNDEKIGKKGKKCDIIIGIVHSFPINCGKYFIVGKSNFCYL